MEDQVRMFHVEQTATCPHIGGDQSAGGSAPLAIRLLKHAFPGSRPAYVLKFIEDSGRLQRGQGEGTPV